MIERLPWALVSDAVARLLGLHFPAGRTSDLRRGIAAAAKEAGTPLDAFVQPLLDGRLDEPAIELLAHHLTVGETYFFRSPECLDALRLHVLPALIARRGESRRLRLWSAGCCTGEEPYTVAMLLREQLPDIDTWHISILATDLNPRFLHKAAQGIYGEWSFRTTPAALRAKYFRSIGNGRHAIDEAVRAMVNFQPLNLSRDTYPSIDTGTNAIDLILCRNVLMYFDAEQIRRVVGRLRAALQPDGWLSVAPCETSATLFADFTAERFADAVFYRRTAARVEGLPASIPPSHGPTLPPSSPTSTRLDRGRRASGGVCRKHGVRGPEPLADAAASPLGYRAKSLADQGKLAEARAMCERWIGQEKLDVAAHYLHALVAMELGDAAAAAASLHRCAYLAPDAPMINFALGNLERTRGHHARALRLYRYTQELVAGLASDAAIAYSDGLSAGQLAALVHDLISTEELHGRAA